MFYTSRVYLVGKVKDNGTSKGCQIIDLLNLACCMLRGLEEPWEKFASMVEETGAGNAGSEKSIR